MAFKDLASREQGVQLLQRSLERGRLAHAYLFAGQRLDELEALARTLGKTLNCEKPARSKTGGVAIDCCDACLSCRKIDHHNHADVHWVRPESKSRVILIEQMRDLMREINLTPTEAEFKVAVIVAADRLNIQAANAFLKTLEEPPPKSVLILLSTEPQRILETIQSRCLRLKFLGDGAPMLDAAQMEWLRRFAEMAAGGEKSLLARYRLLGVLSKRLAEIRAEVEAALTQRSPLTRYEDYDNVEPELREKWEEELKAAVEAEYRRQRADLLGVLQLWLRDLWLHALPVNGTLTHFPQLTSTANVASRIKPTEAMENLCIWQQTQTLLNTNVQESLTLEVGLLKLHL